MSRIAIVDKDRCKPNKCQRECIRSCPPQRGGKTVIEIIDIEDIGFTATITTNKHKIAKIVESMCIGCNQCVRVCPFNAIKIVNIPKENPTDIVHRYGPNGFRLYCIPIMKKNCIMSLVGQNGIGKSTILDILSNRLVPNFENLDPKSPFKGTVLKKYFDDLYKNKLTISIKHQKIKQHIKDVCQTMTVQEYILSMGFGFTTEQFDSTSWRELELTRVLKNPISTLSGGELQRLLCWITISTPANVYIFDEPSNFLDVKQRLIVAKLIRSLKSPDTYVLVVDHDLSLLDFISDEINILYGSPGAYGIVSQNLTTANGINEYLDGYISSQNIRFRNEPFNLAPYNDKADDLITTSTSTYNVYTYSDTHVSFPGFTLDIPSAQLTLTNQIYLILGENGVGKTTYLNEISKNVNKSVSYKTQHSTIKKYMKPNQEYPTVLELFQSLIRESYSEPTFQTSVFKSLNLKSLEHKLLNELSGGELQRVMLCLTLGTSADIYLLDEPSSNLDIESRLGCIRAIKQFSHMCNKCIFIIEHDIMMAVAWAQEPNCSILHITEVSDSDAKRKHCRVSECLTFHVGINSFLESMNITMRISEANSRPRINKPNSQLDTHQKKLKCYYGSK